MEDILLLWRLKHGRKEALRRMYEKYSDDMFTLAVALIHDKPGAEDIVHDVFVAFAQLAAKTGCVRNLKAYLMACVANRAREKMRSPALRTAATADEPAAEYDPADALVADEAHRKLIAAMKELPYEQQEVILLHIRGGLTFKAIAGHQSVSINTVQGRYRYGLDKLRFILADSEVNI
jgi:RNA polymerase sigma factor (sigma-70 family)